LTNAHWKPEITPLKLSKESLGDNVTNSNWRRKHRPNITGNIEDKIQSLDFILYKKPLKIIL
jgi:hypothetical protein